MKRKETIVLSFVIVFHLFFFFYHFKKPIEPIKPKNTIVVRTHLPPKPKPTLNRPVSQKKQTLKPKQVAKAQKKAPPKQAIKKQEAKKESPPPTPLTVPKEIKALQIDQAETKKEEANYLEEFVRSFQLQLQLPEEGSVRLRVTVLQSGRVEKVEVLYAENQKNKAYLEHALIALELPPFTGELAKKNKHTFTLTFCNDE